MRDGNDKVLRDLYTSGHLIKDEPITHKYPYDWRTKKPIIIRATSQWFASVENVQKDCLDSISEVNIIPESGRARLSSMIENRQDWCISRQRYWGVPIPVFYNTKTNEHVLNSETITHISNIFKEKGSNAWWELSIKELLPEGYDTTNVLWRIIN